MLTRLHIRNFKRFGDVSIDLGNAVVFIGPNNSGKSTALQALSLWEIGLRRWNEKRSGGPSPQKRPGVTLNRRDLISVPVPGANLLWRDLHVRDVQQVSNGGVSKPRTENVRIDIVVDGVSSDGPWSCGLEFDYANQESLYCRPLRLSVADAADRVQVPPAASGVRLAYLPPMSGLAATEPKWEPGRINVLIGEGQTAQVLRNLCYQVLMEPRQPDDWARLKQHVDQLFGVELLEPQYVAERGEIAMTYRERRVELDLSSAGRGLQQTLLLLAHLYANPNTVLLLDEPDAHLEILRQRQTYQLLTEAAAAQGSQIIAASHSEVVLNEAADRHVVVAFVGRPHRIDCGPAQVLKALREIGFDQYYQAEQRGWVLYIEGPSDLAILRAFARTLNHPAQTALERPFVHYVATNLPQRAREHFYGLREAKGDLVGIALFDRLDKKLESDKPLVETMWRRREIENYFCDADVLRAFAHRAAPGELFSAISENAMQAAIEEVSDALRTLSKPDPWSGDTKATDDFLEPVFRKFYEKLKLPLELRKSDYFELAALTPRERVDPEIVEKLAAIEAVARRARPVGE